MFSYHKAKHALLFTIIGVGAVLTIGIVSATNNDTGNPINDLFGIFQEEKTSVHPGQNDGGGMPTSESLLRQNDGGGMPTSENLLKQNDGGGMPT